MQRQHLPSVHLNNSDEENHCLYKHQWGLEAAYARSRAGVSFRIDVLFQGLFVLLR
jgi:hypothetical protein